MQLRYVFSELGQGLRRNLSMHLAVILTLLVSLTLVGVGVLLRAQSDKAADQWGSELQITAFLCKDRDQNPACTAEVTDAQKKQIAKVVDDNPEVDSYYFETKAQAFEKVKELLGAKQFEGPNAPATADDMPESIWITLKDPDQYQGIESAITGLDGVSRVRDQREVVGPILGSMKKLQLGSGVTALILVVAAVLLVANTIRLAAFARRREIAIMRLVGASRISILLPFLMEALVTAAIALVLTLGVLAGFVYFYVYRSLRHDLGFIPWIEWSDTTLCVVAVCVLAPVLTVLPTLVVTRKYLKV